MIPPEKVDTYRKVRALADRGATEGERASARAILAQMDARYPGIRIAADSLPGSGPGVPPTEPGFRWDEWIREMFSDRGAPSRPPRPPPGTSPGTTPRGARAGGSGGFTGSPPPSAVLDGDPSTPLPRGPSARDVQSAVDVVQEFLRGVVEEERLDADRRALIDAHATVTSHVTDDGDLVVRLRVTQGGRRAFRRRGIDLWAVAQQVGKDVADEFVAIMEEEAEAEAGEAAPKRRVRQR